MARKNIFQQLSSNRNFVSEIQRIDKLLEDEVGILIEIDRGYFNANTKYESIVTFVDDFAFKEWKYRQNCIDCQDMSETLGFDELLEYDEDDEIEEEDLLSYLEYVANILNLVETVKLKQGCSYKGTDIYHAAKANVRNVLEWLNYEEKVFENGKKVIITEKNPAATAVAEVVDEELAYKVIQYNHYILKGDIETKKTILLALGQELEPRRKELLQIDKDLEDGIFFMLNNLNLRHNNKSRNDKNYKAAVAKMNKKNLEEWYDELYQMMLLAQLELEQAKRKEKVKELKEIVTEKES